MSVEDNSRSGGIGSAIAAALRDAAGRRRRSATSASRSEFLHHASRASVLASLGLTAQDVSRGIVETVARLDHTADDEAAGEAQVVDTTTDSDVDSASPDAG